MKKTHYLTVLIALFFSHFYGMEKIPTQVTAQVEVCFSPENRYYMKSKLFALIDKAQNSIYVAMYWITDDSIVDKLIEAKKRNINVEVFFDSSTPNQTIYMNKFLNNNITPIIFPSGPLGQMHNKFVIIDFNTVFTGSANFTKNAFDFTNPNYNFENTVILYSNDIATQFLKEFVNMEKKIFEIYIDMVAQYESKNLPQWLHTLGPILVTKKGRMNQALYSRLNTYNVDDIQRQKLLNFFIK